MVGEISVAELKDRIDAGDPPRIVDIRSPSEFERGHIPESENVPFDALPTAIKAFEGDQDVVTVCPHGQASIQAARLIESYEGVSSEASVDSLAGGIEAWDGRLVTEETAD